MERSSWLCSGAAAVCSPRAHEAWMREGRGAGLGALEPSGTQIHLVRPPPPPGLLLLRVVVKKVN